MMKYTQEMLPDFEKICAEASQKGLDGKDTLSKQYIRYAKMEQKCQNPQVLRLISRQKKRLVDDLGRVRG